jgi:S1-C subfamily serine protease
VKILDQTTLSFESTSQKWKLIAIGLIAIIIINIGFFAYITVDLNKQFDAVQNQYTILHDQMRDNDQEVRRLQQKIDLLTAMNLSQSSYPSITAIFDVVKDSVVLIETKVQTVTGLQDNAQGSGFIYDHEGHIITNNHVIEDSDEIWVTFTNGQVTKATIIGTDPYSDIAIIQVSGETIFPVVLGNSSNLNVGEPIVAVGNPYGLSSTITAGIVSQLGRDLAAPDGYLIVDVIQLDAAINPGNSGGPLVNMWGEVVGVTTAIISGSTGVGFAIPSDTIQRELPDLLATGQYLHPWLGISGFDVDLELAETLGLNTTEGVVISEVIISSPADVAGIQENDIIIVLNEQPVRNINDLSVFLERNTHPDDTVTITLLRNSQELELQVVLGVRP